MDTNPVDSPHAAHAEDFALARHLADGDENALQKFYERFADPLFAFIYHHIETRQGTEDIWQETLISALNSIDTYQGKSQLFTWLCGLARHKIADHFRKQGRVDRLFSDIPLVMLTDPEPLPEEVITNHGTRLKVIKALASLPEDYHTALVLRYADEFSVAEVAKQLRRSYKATESLLARARQAFRDALLKLEEN